MSGLRHAVLPIFKYVADVVDSFKLHRAVIVLRARDKDEAALRVGF